MGAFPTAGSPASNSGLTSTAPHPLGSRRGNHSSIEACLTREVIEAGVARAASAGIAVRAGQGWRCASAHVGSLRPASFGAIDERAVYDLASVTKPFVALAAARLVEGGELTWDTPLCRMLPESSDTPVAAASLELLLSHRAGLEAHRELFGPLCARRPMDRRAALRAALHARRTDCSGPVPVLGFPPVYSDLGYILVGEALAQHQQSGLERLVQREVCKPLQLTVGSARTLLSAHPPQTEEHAAEPGMPRNLVGRASPFRERVVPTEVVAFRGGVVRAVVHDENAWALAGHGMAGHAGLFGTLDDVLCLGRRLLDVLAGRDMTWLTSPTLEAMLADRPGGTLRLGFDGKSTTGSSAGNRASSRSFGHLGFTGTSIWCDPEADAVSVLLTNRVCPSRSNTKIRACRPVVHEALFELAQSLRAGLH
ncbi:MAG TPA: serine hydrolase domain-containing protein [Polyangiaceae bacterium]|nr:serine hydrolase domain-containing protein [Polyangiaceae bacterium]